MLKEELKALPVSAHIAWHLFAVTAYVLVGGAFEKSLEHLLAGQNQVVLRQIARLPHFYCVWVRSWTQVEVVHVCEEAVGHDFESLDLVFTALPLFLVVVGSSALQRVQLSQTVLECFGTQLKARDVLLRLCNIVGLVENDYRIFVVDVVILPDFFIDQVVVRHKDNVCLARSVFRRVVRAKLVPLRHLVDLLDVEWLPREVLATAVPVLKIQAWIEALLRILARRI